MSAAYRYAVYFRPPQPWGQVGRNWLGRCEETGALILDQRIESDRADESWTQAPRRYGLHATLKAPFRLAPTASPAQLDRAVRALAARHTPFAVQIGVTRLRAFLAWCVRDDPAGEHAMRALADDAVAALDSLRAPPAASETAKRLAAPLGAAERAMLARWGYPYAFDTFKFHISLTGHLESAALDQAHARLIRLSAPFVGTAMPVAAIAVYVQPEPDSDFVVAREYDFSGVTRDGAGHPYLPPTAAGGDA